jgi:hypothetical protein
MENDDQFRFESVLRHLSAEELKAVAAAVKVEDTQIEADGEDKKKLLRSIQAILDDDPSQLKQMMKLTIPYVPEDAAQKIMAILMAIKETGAEPKVEDNRDMVKLLKTLGIEDGNSTFRREFRITGSIGMTTGCITYISLCSQIRDGKKKGYSKDELTAAIKKAVSPGTELRTILDVKADMPLDDVLTFIRLFMKEKTATELYKHLNEVAQQDNEDAQTFVLRAMELRERLTVAPDIEGIVRFDKSQIQDMFLHAIRTGLRDVSVRARLEEPLRRGVSDEKLLTEVNAAATEEMEREKKRDGLNKTIASASSTYAQSSSGMAAGETEMLGMMSSLKKEVKSFKAEVADLKALNE